MLSPPAVDIPDGLVIGTFGQPYTEPATVMACNAADPKGFNESCEQPGSFIHSIVATVTGGSWAAVDPETGRILWQTADPTVAIRPGFSSPVGVWDLAPVTVANGVLYTASMAKQTEGDDMYALDAATGQILWSYNAGSSVNAAAAVVDGSVYWGTGYSRSGVEGSGNTRLYAFSIGGN